MIFNDNEDRDWIRALNTTWNDDFVCFGWTWFCDQWKWIMTIFHQPSGLNRASYLPWAIVFTTCIFGIAPQGHLQKSCKERSMSSVTACSVSLLMADDPQAKGMRHCQDEAQGNAASPLGIYLSCSPLLFVTAFLRHDLSWASVYIGRWDVYEVFWWYDFYYSTWAALSFVFDRTACYLLYAVSHGWLCTFMLGVLTP